MEIFGIGLPELLMIAAVALVVLGPDRLPEAARTLGKAVGDLRRAIEPARSAWADVTREITDVTRIPAGQQGGNPWAVHPVAEGLTPEETDRLFTTGELPEWKRLEMDKMEVSIGNGDMTALNGELPDLEYPMPHAELPYDPAHPFKAEPEELSYPEPGANTNKEEES